MKFPTLNRKSKFGQPKDGLGALGLGEQRVKGEPRRGESTEGGGLEGKDRTFASFPVGAATVSCKDFLGLLCMKSGKLHISGLSNVSQSIADFTSLSSPHLKRKERSVM